MPPGFGPEQAIGWLPVCLVSVDRAVTAKVGSAREHRLGPAQLQEATGWIDGYRRAWERRLDRFGAYVEEQP